MESIRSRDLVLKNLSSSSVETVREGLLNLKSRISDDEEPGPTSVNRLGEGILLLEKYAETSPQCTELLSAWDTLHE
eukprot:CAMPEP_0184367758 /NCGR_PEP_ID=MMETSP1089-20130417/159767_1 /TAXON_ID=38269 ORGANISM="Gloeochaete wittrockiana, Strain SAG46.84" /NCGR_SAMPLE_ID=MMETSP1089 /ASSEMBLY_ACC=CAM_ASM_000445 /LENGTH=76 /DNA_ID=CAMNT_0026709861 /DNA_START=38 /DNA_END=265 /DNA_ORIENTATION=+